MIKDSGCSSSLWLVQRGEVVEAVLRLQGTVFKPAKDLVILGEEQYLDAPFLR